MHPAYWLSFPALFFYVGAVDGDLDKALADADQPAQQDVGQRTGRRRKEQKPRGRDQEPGQDCSLRPDPPQRVPRVGTKPHREVSDAVA